MENVSKLLACCKCQMRWFLSGMKLFVRNSYRTKNIPATRTKLMFPDSDKQAVHPTRKLKCVFLNSKKKSKKREMVISRRPSETFFENFKNSYRTKTTSATRTKLIFPDSDKQTL